MVALASWHLPWFSPVLNATLELHSVSFPGISQQSFFWRRTFFFFFLGDKQEVAELAAHLGALKGDKTASEQVKETSGSAPSMQITVNH